jgi:cation diffusion facilitator family transporter
MSARSHANATIRWAASAFVVSLLLSIAKFIAYKWTASTALLSDALESLINIGTSAFALYAVWLSAKPRDDDHPYGHGKIEYLAAGIEGALISAAGVIIAIVAIPRLWNVIPIERISVGLAISAAIAAVALGFGQLLVLAGRRLESLTIESDGAHLRSDGLTTAGAFVALVIVAITGWTWVDPLAALIMACWLLISGVNIVRRAVGGLMDEAVPELLDTIAERLESVRQPGWLSPHHAKIHRHGQYVHIDMHLVLPRYWSLEQSHDVTHVIEESLHDAFGERSEIMIHMEPCRPDACSGCDISDCPVRAAAFEHRDSFSGRAIRLPYRKN